MLYKKNSQKELPVDLFKSPTAEYRATPFWAWNCKLDKSVLEEQIGHFKEMGFGGFHMHSRVGLDTAYLSDEFMDAVRHCVDKAEEKDMLAWLYDEDKWPSGFAGGYVTADPRYRMRKLLFTEENLQGDVSLEQAYLEGKNSFLAAYEIVLNERGTMSSYRRIERDAETPHKKRYAFFITDQPSSWHNNHTYVDTMSVEAMKRFTEITHERYKNAVGDRFGKCVPSMFTDEPQLSGKIRLDKADSDKAVHIAWTSDFGETFEKQYGYDLLDRLPELFYDDDRDVPSVARYHYHDHTAERFTRAFADTCGDWCEKNGIAFTGHANCEDTLEGQTICSGECMRFYRKFGLPGIDVLCDQFLYTTAKQAQSAAHQYAKEGVTSELYGVTNWTFDFRGHKRQGDWQAALGVTVRVPHLAWVSMAGDAKRDYPASIGYQSPWYREYAYIEDHFARLNTALTRGTPLVNIAVVHPVESTWIHFGVKQTSNSKLKRLEQKFQQLGDWLIHSLADYDYICESLLPQQVGEVGNTLRVGAMGYQTVIVAGCDTLRSSTVEVLEKFRRAGGRVLFVGDVPRYVDAVPSNRVIAFAESCEKVSFDEVSVVEALEQERECRVLTPSRENSGNFIMQRRQDGDGQWLFLARTKEHHGFGAWCTAGAQNVVDAESITVSVRGDWSFALYDTLSGDVKPLPCRYANGYTETDFTSYSNDSYLLRMMPVASRESVDNEATAFDKYTAYDYLDGQVKGTREEPNVLVLDMARYAVDAEPLSEKEEEILRIRAICRERMQFPNDNRQPWVISPQPITHTLHLSYQIECQTDLDGILLAMEDAEKAAITLNGKKIDVAVCGWYVDRAFKKLPLPSLKKGSNTLDVVVPFGNRSSVESLYLLGDFHVSLLGRDRILSVGTDELRFGSITEQGMPFYGGNISYQTTFTVPSGACGAVLRVHDYAGALLFVELDGKPVGRIAFAPYELELPCVDEGEHTLRITCFGNRNNTFGALHLNDGGFKWFGGDAYRTEGDSFCYEYRVKATGILSAPRIKYILK